jgi:predicted DNA-binding ribbon-helix-helix protein
VKNPVLRSPVVKRSIVIAGHKTSVSLEDQFWEALKAISLARGISLSDQVQQIDQRRKQGNLSSAIRLFVLDYYRSNESAGSGPISDGERPAASL